MKGNQPKIRRLLGNHESRHNVPERVSHTQGPLANDRLRSSQPLNPIQFTESSMRHLVVNTREDGTIVRSVESFTPGELAEGECRIQVHWSSLNFKDALASEGHRGVVRQLPLTPGIDAVGVVVESHSERFSAGDEVLATGHDFGVARDGGWSESLDAPAEQLVALPDGLSMRDAMIFGTAGFTAVQCVEELASRGVTPDSGEVLVTGATGGVGSIAVALLAQAGYTVVGSTGKTDKHAWLQQLGVNECISREDAAPSSDKPMLAARWAGAVDTVGGATLTSVVKSLKPSGAVAACGVVAGADLPLTVYPFILRGVSLIGVDSAWHPYEDRVRIWNRISSALDTTTLESLVASQVDLDGLEDQVARILQGGVCGRTIVCLESN